MVSSITLDYCRFDLLPYALGSSSDKGVAAYTSAGSIEAL